MKVTKKGTGRRRTKPAQIARDWDDGHVAAILSIAGSSEFSDPSRPYLRSRHSFGPTRRARRHASLGLFWLPRERSPPKNLLGGFPPACERRPLAHGARDRAGKDSNR